MIEIHGGETAGMLYIDDMAWPGHVWMSGRMLQCNAMVAGTDFTQDSGATQVVPGSHRWEDPERVSDACELGHAVMKAGSIVFVGAKTRHGGGTNMSGEARRAIGTSFVLGWLRTQETRFLHTTVEQAQQWAQRARQLLGYDLYSHYDEALMAGPLDDYEYGSLPALFENKT